MNLKMHGLKVLGIALITALGLMAFTAAGAQATGEWKIGGQTMTALGITEESFTGNLGTGIKRLFLIKSLNIEIKCSAWQALNALIRGHGHLKLRDLLKICKVFADEGEEPELSACGVKSTGKAAGEIETVEIEGEVILSEGTNYVLTKPAVAGPFATIEITGAACAEKGSYPLTGTVVYALGTEAKELFITPVKEFTGDGLKFGENKAFMGGAALLQLTGAKTGAAWTGF